MLPGTFTPTAFGASAAEIINAMAANSGSFVSAHPSNYVGGMETWGSTQTFSNSPTTNLSSANIFRDGDTNDSLFTAGADTGILDVSATTALVWQTSRVTTVPQDVKINGAAATEVASAQYGTATTDDKTYYQSYALHKALVPLIASTTTTSADFQTAGAVTRSNDKGGFVFLPGSWDVASTGSGLSGVGTLSIPSRQVVLLLGVASPDAIVNVFGFGTNANLSFILNYAVSWYDALQVAVIGNPTGVTQSVSYSINAVHSPKPVFLQSLEG
jgi:hypothetical protein